MLAEQFSQTQTAPTPYDPSAKPAVDFDLSLCKPEERPRMVALINRLAKSPKGLETLEIAKQAGFALYFYQGSATTFGSASPEKKLRLNGNISDDKLIGTLCHESRHAGQFFRTKGIKEDRFDIHTRMMFNRAKEADAQVYAVSACEELKRQGDSGPAEKFAEFYLEIHQAFTDSLAGQNGDINTRVMTETFKAWYDQTKIKGVYERTCLLEPMDSDATRLDYGNAPLMFFDEKMGSRDIADLMTWTKDSRYFKDDPAILESGKYVDIAEETSDSIKRYFDARKYETGEEPDPTIAKLPIRPNEPVKAEAAAEKTSDRLEKILAYKETVGQQKKAVRQKAAVQRKTAGR